MRHHITSIYGNRLGARDGDIGHVKDIYFEDRRWHVRYVVADTGTWLSQRQVLLPPQALRGFDEEEHVLRIDLSRTQIENSPAADSHRPVSRQHEATYVHYRGWPVYWISDGMGGLGGYSGLIPAPAEPDEGEHRRHSREDLHLRSTRAITGYEVHALDGAVGQVCDFVVDENDWSIREVIVQCGRWFSARKIRISSHDIERISYKQSSVFVVLIREDFRRANERAVATVDSSHRRALGIEE